jgi:hypothetical protein
MTLINIGKEYSEEVREDITLGKILPAIGSKLTYIEPDVKDPNVVFPNTLWSDINDYSVEIGPTTYECHEWIRLA